MSSLFSAAQALRVFEKALEVIQNNVSNASTPGFAKQRLALQARAFEPDLGLVGGVEAGRLESARDAYAEHQVRRASQFFARSGELAAQLARIEPVFDVSGESGIPAGLSALFQSFSSWSVAPNDPVARRVVIERAGELAARFNETAGALAGAEAAADLGLRNSADSVNELVRRLRGLNVEFRRDARNMEDPGLDARVETTLEQLSEYVDFTILRQSDGSLTVLLGGRTPLLVGEQQFEIATDSSSGQTVLLAADGADITAQAGQGRLGALLEFRNEVAPSLLADLNRLAAALAGRLNAQLAAGLDANGQPGAPLFTYGSAADAATTLHVTGITPAELAAAAAGAPGGNGNALDLAALADSPEIDGFTFLGFYGTVARRAGRALESAREDRDTTEQLLLQARALRDDISRVSLDEEAVRLIEFQRSYQATGKLVGAVQEMLDSLIAMMR